MDTRSGEFVEDERAESWMQRIDIGEVVKIKGAELEVVGIAGREIRLCLLSASDRAARALGDVYGAGYENDRDAEIKRQRAKMLKHQR